MGFGHLLCDRRLKKRKTEEWVWCKSWDRKQRMNKKVIIFFVVLKSESFQAGGFDGCWRGVWSGSLSCVCHWEVCSYLCTPWSGWKTQKSKIFSDQVSQFLDVKSACRPSQRPPPNTHWLCRQQKVETIKRFRFCEKGEHSLKLRLLKVNQPHLFEQKGESLCLELWQESPADSERITANILGALYVLLLFAQTETLLKRGLCLYTHQSVSVAL